MDKDELKKIGKSVLSIKLKGRKYDTSSFDLMKIPVEWLYSEALCKIGEQESYIEELKSHIEELKATTQKLQEENDKLKKGLLKADNRALRLEVKREEMYKFQRDAIKKYKRERDDARNRISELITHMISEQSRNK